MFALGEQVWVAVAKQHVAIEQKCPDCHGQKYLTVILGDNSQVTIDCSTCTSGYNPPRGYVLVDTYKPDAFLAAIKEITKNVWDEIAYSGDGFYRKTEAELSDNKESALALAFNLAEEAYLEEKARLQRKEKDTRTWAWHVTYHRRCVKQAEKELAYHTAKLSVALQHKKAGTE